MDAKLKERAQNVAQLRNSSTRFTEAQYREIGEVHHLLTGRNVACIPCNVYGLISEVNSKLIQEPLIIQNMANAKGHFKSGTEGIKIIRHGKNGPTVITPENINEGDNFKWAAENGYAHLVEETKASKAEAATEAKAAAPTTSKKKRKAAAKATAKPAEPTPAVTTTEPTTAAE